MESETIKNEIKKLNTQLKTITNQRNELIISIRAKYREMVKNADDALKYVGEYIKLTIDFHSWQFEGDDSYFINLCNESVDYCEILQLFKELCNPYIKVIDFTKDLTTFGIIYERK